MKTAILTISTSVAAGRNEDTSGQLLAELAQAAGAEIAFQEVVSDDRQAIEEALRRYVRDQAALVFTTGGTGLTPDDVTPEAPGFAEAMRAESTRIKPLGMLSRGVSGTAGGTLIINFPGNPKAIRELFPVIAPTLQHAIATLHREPGRAHGADAGHAGH